MQNCCLFLYTLVCNFQGDVGLSFAIQKISLCFNLFVAMQWVLVASVYVSIILIFSFNACSILLNPYSYAPALYSKFTSSFYNIHAVKYAILLNCNLDNFLLILIILLSINNVCLKTKDRGCSIRVPP